MWELLGVLAGALVSNLFAAGRESGARMENFQFNEKAAQAADTRTRKLYNDLYSPQAQISQIKEAGLSPSLFYSGGVAGGSGQSGAMGHGAAGISPTTYGIDAGQAAQIALTEAQTKNVEADTEIKKKEGQFVEERATAEISKIWKEAGLAEASTKLTESQNEMQKLLNSMKEATSDVEIWTYYANYSKLSAEAQNAWEMARESKVKADVAEQLEQDYVEQVRNQNAEMLANIANLQAQKKLTEQQIENLKNEIKVSLKQVEINLQNAETQARQADNEKEANRIRNLARYDEMTRFNAELKYKYQELNIGIKKFNIEFGEKVVSNVHIGNQYSAVQYNETTTTYKKR